MDILNEIEKLNCEIKKVKSIKNYDQNKNKNKAIFWENQCHDMQINKSIIAVNVVPFLNELRKEYQNLLRGFENLKNENKNLKNENENLTKQNKTIPKNRLLLKKKNENLKKEIENLKKDIENLTKQNKTISKNRLLSKKKNENLKKDIENLKKNQLVPFKNRGGCKLTDKQIERLLLIYAKRDKYANMSFNKAISTVAQTRNTYYKVIKLDYQSEATRERIRAIAFKNDIKLPNKN